MARIAVAHLVRYRNSNEALARFLKSYRQFDAGVEHDLIVIFKGFPGKPSSRDACLELLQGIPHRILEVREEGFDIQPYCDAARTFDYPYFCFLNSFSVLLAGGWLEKLYRAIRQDNVGLAGASGSYQSFRPSSLASYVAQSRQVGIRSPVKRAIMALPFAYHLNYLRGRLKYASDFNPFPNYHIRTNAFIVSREVMLQSAPLRIRTKLDAYKFESGKRGLTMRVLESGHRALIVCADGQTFNKEEWHLSDTFWQAGQQRLMVADNQTRRYADGTPEIKAMLSRYAWGNYARPG